MYVGLMPRCAASSVRNRAEFEDRAGPDHAFGRNPAPPCDRRDNLGHHINRIARHQKDRVRRGRQHRRHDLCEDFGVARQQVQPTLPRPLVGPGCNHDHARAIKIGRLTRTDPDRIGKRRSVQNIARLRDRQIRVAIDKHDLRTDAAHHHGISRGGADLSGPDNADLHAVAPMSRTDTRAKQRLRPRGIDRPPRADLAEFLDRSKLVQRPGGSDVRLTPQVISGSRGGGLGDQALAQVALEHLAVGVARQRVLEPVESLRRLVVGQQAGAVARKLFVLDGVPENDKGVDAFA